MKQSSINWLYDNLKSHFEHDGDLLEAVQMSFKQAKEMHKEEIENAYWDGGQWIPLAAYQCEDYYNETFNTKDCPFYSTMDTTSATICANCGREKFEHNL